VPPPISHIRGRDQRREIAKRNKSPKPISQEAGPGTVTQAYREEITSQNEVQEVKYAPENHFRSIYKVEDRVIEKKPPTKNIEFLEKRPEPTRQHQNLKSMTV
ncbi:5003_t:CDS:1, partial [Dentiscutata erythropus]